MQSFTTFNGFVKPLDRIGVDAIIPKPYAKSKTCRWIRSGPRGDFGDRLSAAGE